MSLDLSKYEGHTKTWAGYWRNQHVASQPVSCGWICTLPFYQDKEVMGWTNQADWQLIVDAPQLLAELREERAINQELAGALSMLLDDTQHKDHECGGDCPVIHAKVALQKYEALIRKDA